MIVRVPVGFTVMAGRRRLTLLDETDAEQLGIRIRDMGEGAELMTSVLYVTDLSPFGARLRLVEGFTGQSLAEERPPGGSGSPAMKAISFFGKIPAIVVDDQVLIESVPLMEYLVETAGGSPLMPATPETRALMRGIILAHDHYVLGAIRPLFLQLRTGKPDPAIVVPALHDGALQYDVLTRLFDPDGDYAIGGRVTLADLAIVPFAFIFARSYPMFSVPDPFATAPRLARWWGAVSALPEVQKVTTAMDAAFSLAFVK